MLSGACAAGGHRTDTSMIVHRRERMPYDLESQDITPVFFVFFLFDPYQVARTAKYDVPSACFEA